MVGLVVNSSDLVLAAGISFWTGVVETQRVQDIQDCYHIIKALRGFLQQKNAAPGEENNEGFDADNSTEEKGRKVGDSEKSIIQDTISVVDVVDPIEKSIEKKWETPLDSAVVNVNKENLSQAKIEDQETSTEEKDKRFETLSN